MKFDASFQTSVDVIGFMDADWAGDVVERKSFQACIGTVSWRSKRQEIVALSSTKAEHVALSFAAQELMWLITFLKDLRHKQQSNVLNEDNQGAIAFSKNLVNHSLRKHISRNKEERTLTISQKMYLENVLKRFNMHDYKPVATPIDPNQSLITLKDD